MKCRFSSLRPTLGLRPIIYDIVADCYKTVADEVGKAPADFQAILWHSWKRQYPRTWKIQHRKQWSVMGEY